MQISHYMENALFDKDSGFYQNQKITDHFHTPLSLNSGLKKVLSQYLLKHQAPILEVGPSSHALLAQELLLQGLSQELYLCEKSNQARSSLEKQFANNSNVKVYESLPNSFNNGVIFLQEVLDCFSANWFSYQNRILYQHYIDSSFNLYKKVVDQPEECPYYIYLKGHKMLLDNTQYYYSQSATNFFKQLLSYKNNTIILIDYGFLTSDLLHANTLVKSPLRAYKNHEQLEHFWTTPGQCDLTYDIDFEWYLTLAVKANAKVEFYGSLAQFVLKEFKGFNDISLLKPYLDPRMLGEIFKVAVIKTL